VIVPKGPSTPVLRPFKGKVSAYFRRVVEVIPVSKRKGENTAGGPFGLACMVSQDELFNIPQFLS
jgi:hypothetical protein